ncbi:prepilin-type N-terminal cleavage/methylation domain-containing protein [Shewanella woodyi]|uniref:Methylation site containing protein n=1 Tax=Shewanella woodyi (strain ATCC 51908 / MS32) TaxID=392500 RepID=B1KR59_SHEWM|nr:prepilin-type N-terminal cleavage/methylation domain-containing protein [Shewanella woodyi]ACA84876.1 conserved hypothetical protein [Shewanella woodyi ATCC 51908]
MKNQSGFTLIEMIISIIVIGILAVVALPRFIHISDDAKIAVADGMAASFESSIKPASSKHVIENKKGFIVIDGSIVSFRSDNEIKSYPQAGDSRACAELWNKLTEGERASDFEDEYIHSVFYEKTCEYSIEEQIFTYNNNSGEVVRI